MEPAQNNIYAKKQTTKNTGERFHVAPTKKYNPNKINVTIMPDTPIYTSILRPILSIISIAKTVVSIFTNPTSD